MIISFNFRRISSGKISGNMDKELDNENNKGVSDETKTYRKEDSLSLLNQDPVNDRAEHFCYFFGKNSPFSNFHPAKFVLDGMEYSCSEQYMMYQKASKQQLCNGIVQLFLITIKYAHAVNTDMLKSLNHIKEAEIKANLLLVLQLNSLFFSLVVVYNKESTNMYTIYTLCVS